MCEAISRNRCVRKNRARARARNAALLFSARQEPSAHGRHRLSFVCVEHVATVHFSAAPISATAQHTRVNGVLSESES